MGNQGSGERHNLTQSAKAEMIENITKDRYERNPREQNSRFDAPSQGNNNPLERKPSNNEQVNSNAE